MSRTSPASAAPRAGRATAMSIEAAAAWVLTMLFSPSGVT